MFKKSRRKIVAAIMSFLTLMWAGTIALIYISGYSEMSRENTELLKTHARMYSLPKVEQYMPPENPVMAPFSGGNRENTPAFRLSVFYSVALSYDGEVLATENENEDVHTDEELKELSRKIMKEKKDSGRCDDLVYYKTDKGGYILVTFMDNTLINQSAAALIRYTLIFGGCAVVLFFFFAVFAAKRIVSPLEEGYEKQKRFISDAGHELKTPVSVIGANAELLSREVGQNRWLDNIRYENDRMGSLVGQLLSLARTEREKPSFSSLDMSRLVKGETLPFESVSWERGKVLSYEIEDGICVMGDDVALRQVVSVLLDNAVAHGEGQDIRLVLKKERGSAVLSVINGGREIPEEQRKRMFERFYRGDSSRKSDGHYGLGLSIAYSSVLSHKGKTEVLCYDGLVEFRVQIPAL